MIEIKSHISLSEVSAVYTTNVNNENKYIPSCPCSPWMLSSIDWSQGELCCWLLWSTMGSAACSRHYPLEMPCRWKSLTEKTELIALRVRRIILQASKQGQSWEGREKKCLKKRFACFPPHPTPHPAILVSEAFSYIWLHFLALFQEQIEELKLGEKKKKDFCMIT